MSVAADFPSGRKALPSRKTSASNLPGPQLARTLFRVPTSILSRSVIGFLFGARPTIAPTLRSRFGQPSRRLPIPGANELSTVEWQTAHVSPIDERVPPLLKKPFTPTTAFSFSRASVVRGLPRSTFPALIAAATDFGIFVESTLRPTES